MGDQNMTHADAVYDSALVWDQLYPATEVCGSWAAHTAKAEEMRRAGMSAVSVSVAYDPEDTMTALRRITRWRQFIGERPDRFRLLRSADDARGAKATGQLAIGFHFQGTSPFGRDPGMVQVFYNAGVRQALLAYNHRNLVGDGVHEAADGGLSRYGRRLVAEMQRSGMLVDLSHTGRRTALDAFEMASAPMIYSHINAAAVYGHDRNLDDEAARACAATGGVIGAVGVGMFLGPGPARAEALFAHVDHFVQLLGPAHVGLGLDSVADTDLVVQSMRADPAQWPPDQGYDVDAITALGAADLRRLTGLMLNAGYADDDCRAVLGGNWLRLAEEVWKAPV